MQRFLLKRKIDGPVKKDLADDTKINNIKLRKQNDNYY